VLLPGKRYKRKQREYCHWGEGHGGILPSGERRKTKAINVLPPGNAGGGNKGNTTTRGRRTKRTPQRKYYHRGNLVKRKPSCYYRGNVINENKKSATTKAKATGKYYY